MPFRLRVLGHVMQSVHHVIVTTLVSEQLSVLQAFRGLSQRVMLEAR
jgi:hypothetical protein